MKTVQIIQAVIIIAAISLMSYMLINSISDRLRPHPLKSPVEVIYDVPDTIE